MCTTPAARRPLRAAALLPWAAGLLLGALALGPALAPGSLLNLDLVALPHSPVPSGLWGLGPELPRRAPALVLVSWASAFGAADVAWKALALAAFAVGFVAAFRAARGAPAACRYGAGLLYAGNPFVLTRVGVGHLALVAATAVLPLALPALLRPGDDRSRAVLWGGALAATGVFGGVLALVAVVIGTVADRTSAAVKGAARVVAVQALWVVPGLVVLAQGPELAGGSSFATDAHGLDGVLRLLAGHGFWQRPYQAGSDGAWLVAAAGAAMLALAVAGHRDLPAAWRGRAAVAAAIGLGVALASAVPGVRDLHDAIADTWLGAPLRESQRLLPLYLAWVVPAAALGAARVARAVASATLAGIAFVTPLGLGCLLALPGLWGVDGQLRTIDLSSEWEEARVAVEREPGTVLALPWHQYLDAPFAGDRRVLHPAPYYLPGDVLASTNPRLERGLAESADPRGPTGRALALRLTQPGPVADELAGHGIRWVFLLHALEWRDYDRLADERGLSEVVDGNTLTLLRVEPWVGPVVADDGGVVELDPLVAPLARLDASGPATWHAPGLDGWMRGWHAAGTTADGRVRLPGGAGLVWYWPSVVTLAAYVAVASVLWRAFRGHQRRDRVGSGSGGLPI